MKLIELFEHKLVKEQKINELDNSSIMNRVVQPEMLNQIAQKLDAMFANIGIDIKFTSHFKDRVVDPRNAKPITVGEILKIFTDSYRKYAHLFQKAPDQYEAVLSDLTTKLNVPFILKYNDRYKDFDLVAKTIMRKDNFQTVNPKLQVEYKLNDRQKQNALDEKATIVVTMPPLMFFKLTATTQIFLNAKQRILTKEQYQDLINKDQITLHPFLDVRISDGKVIGHEGRHRALAAYLAGDKQYEVAIRLKPLSRNLNIENMPEILTAQFDAGANYKVNFKDAVAKGIIKILDPNVQKQYQKVFESRLNETQASAVYYKSLPEIYKNLPKLGHGLTSLVLDKGNGKVLMFTRDKYKAEWLTRPWGLSIGEDIETLENMPHKNMKIRNMNICVIELPKLFKLDNKNANIMRKEMDVWNKFFYSRRISTIDKYNKFIEQYPNSLLVPIIEFVMNYDDGIAIDVAVRNTMQDAQGNIILIDPIVDKEIIKAIKFNK